MKAVLFCYCKRRYVLTTSLLAGETRSTRYGPSHVRGVSARSGSIPRSSWTIYRCGRHRRRRQRLSVSDDSTQVRRRHGKTHAPSESTIRSPIVARFAFRTVGSQNHRLLKMLVFQSAPQMTTNSLPVAAMPQPSRVSWLLVIELCEQEDISRSVGIADRGGPKACQNSPGPLSAWQRFRYLSCPISRYGTASMRVAVRPLCCTFTCIPFCKEPRELLLPFTV